MSEPNVLSTVLACPRCGRGPVTLERAGWMCGACSSGYPSLGEIPWLFAEPRQALAEWRGRLSLLTQHLASVAAAMRAGLAGALTAATRRRLDHVAGANEDQVERLRELLAPLGLAVWMTDVGRLRLRAEVFLPTQRAAALVAS